MATATHPTRYERVREILDRTAGDSAADYGGIGRFWDLPLPRLLSEDPENDTASGRSMRVFVPTHY